MQFSKKIAIVKRHKICLNTISLKHLALKCKQIHFCSVCEKLRNTLFHRETLFLIVLNVLNLVSKKIESYQPLDFSNVSSLAFPAALYVKPLLSMIPFRSNSAQ